MSRRIVRSQLLGHQILRFGLRDLALSAQNTSQEFPIGWVGRIFLDQLLGVGLRI